MTREPTPGTQAARILRFLREHPDASTMELQRGLDPFCSNPRARISDLRAAGFDVRCVKRADGFEGFRVVESGPLTLGIVA